jgi:hypothetical protein
MIGSLLCPAVIRLSSQESRLIRTRLVVRAHIEVLSFWSDIDSGFRLAGLVQIGSKLKEQRRLIMPSARQSLRQDHKRLEGLFKKCEQAKGMDAKKPFAMQAMDVSTKCYLSKGRE